MDRKRSIGEFGEFSIIYSRSEHATPTNLRNSSSSATHSSPDKDSLRALVSLERNDPSQAIQALRRASAQRSIYDLRLAILLHQLQANLSFRGARSGGRPIASDESAFVGAESSPKLPQLNVAFIPGRTRLPGQPLL